MATKIFIAHAHEDKDVAHPLAVRLEDAGYEVWYDDFVLRVGDNLRTTIDRGLLTCDFGIVILSRSFFSKPWPQYELDGLATRQLSGDHRIILPVWHEISLEDVRNQAPSLANIFATTTKNGIPHVVREIQKALEDLDAPDDQASETRRQESGNRTITPARRRLGGLLGGLLAVVLLVSIVAYISRKGDADDGRPGATPSRISQTGDTLSGRSSAWSSARAMAHVRRLHTATLLPSGKVLVVAGFDGDDLLTSAELYDPTTNSWATGRDMAQARYQHTATLLRSGKVLVAGGLNDTGLNTAELYAPATSSWSSAGLMPEGRFLHTATLLPSGKVMVAGGLTFRTPLKSAALYDPNTNSWSSLAPMAQARYSATETLLPSGNVLVAGGQSALGGPTLAGAELYDPSTNSWSRAAAMTQPRDGHTATLLQNGKVLFAGGSPAETTLNGAELYDPNSDTWAPAAPMAQPRTAHNATLLQSGKVLVTGGLNNGKELNGAELYNPNSNSWSSAGTMGQARDGHTATLLQSGKVLVTGGHNGIRYVKGEKLYDPDSTSGTEIDGFSPRSGPVGTTVQINGRSEKNRLHMGRMGEALRSCIPPRPWSGGRLHQLCKRRYGYELHKLESS